MDKSRFENERVLLMRSLVVECFRDESAVLMSSESANASCSNSMVWYSSRIYGFEFCNNVAYELGLSVGVMSKKIKE